MSINLIKHKNWYTAIETNKIIIILKITCSDYSELLSAPGDDVFIYLDPPYMINSGLDKQSQLYEYNFSYDIYASIEELTKVDADLLLKARAVTENAYAPYSNFKVSAVALLNNGQIVTG